MTTGTSDTTGTSNSGASHTAVAPPRVSGGEHEHGHLEELRTDPIGLMKRVRDECGDVGMFQLADKKVVLLSGAEANEFFFRSSDEDLDQAGAYPFMTPIFGEGVVFDASPERRKEMLHNTALRGEQMRGHAATIEREVQKMIADWGDEGEIDLLDFFAELTIYTSTACLIGKKFREQLDDRFAAPLPRTRERHRRTCYVDPYAADRELPAPRRSAPRTRRAGAGHHERSDRQSATGQGRPRPARRARLHQGRGRHRAVLAPTRSPACSSR